MRLDLGNCCQAGKYPLAHHITQACVDTILPVKVGGNGIIDLADRHLGMGVCF